MDAAWLSFVEKLIWPLFWGVVLVFSRRQISAIVAGIKSRIEAGDSFSAGPGGISLGQSENKLTRSGSGPSVEKFEKQTTSEQDSGSAGNKTGQDDQRKEVMYLVHRVGRAVVDVDGTERRNIQVQLDADEEAFLDNVKKVIYYLHPTFPNPIREVVDRKSRFALKTRAWGEFNIYADVYFKNSSEPPLRLYRYLNF